MTDAYDVVVIGAGTGGYSTALRAAQLGKRVALVERDERLGGTCLLRGCIPTKALLQSAAVMDTVKRSEEWGIKASGEPDWSAIMAFEDKIVDKLVSGLTGLVGSRGIDVLHGDRAAARRVRPSRSTATAIDAADVVIAHRLAPEAAAGRGGRPTRIITSDQALRYDRIPSSAVVIGAGAVGLEFASFYRSFGADVTVLEALPTVAPLEDADISKAVARAFRKRGIATAAGAAVGAIRDTGDAVEVGYRAWRRGATVEADICLVAVGRGPVTDGLGLEEAGVALARAGVRQGRRPAPHDRRRTSGPSATSRRPRCNSPTSRSPRASPSRSGSPGIDGAGDRLRGDPARDVLLAGDRQRRPHRGAGREQRPRDRDVEKLDFRAIGKANIVGEGGFGEGRGRGGRRPGARRAHDRPARDGPRSPRRMLDHQLGGGPRRGRRADPPPSDPVRGHRRGACSPWPASRCTPRRSRPWRRSSNTTRRRGRRDRPARRPAEGLLLLPRSSAATSTSGWRRCTARAGSRARSTPDAGRRARTSASRSRSSRRTRCSPRTAT